jgi:membrane protease YdiL (CAAX protease family)
MKKDRMQLIYAVLALLVAEAIQLAVIVGFELGYMLLLFIKSGIVRMTGGEAEDLDVIINASQELVTQKSGYLISVIAVFVCGIGFYLWYRREIAGEMQESVKKTFTIRNVILLLLLGVGCQFFISGIMNLVQQYFPQLFEAYANQLLKLTAGNWITVFLLIILIAPVAEELVFRGVILHKAGRAVPFWGANLLQAVLFGVYHMNIIQGIYAVLIGFILGLVYHKFGTILAPMLLHMLINASVLLLALFPESNLAYNILIFAGGITALGALTVIMKK